MPEKKSRPEGRHGFFMREGRRGSGGLGLFRLGGHAAFAFLARQGDRCADTLGHEFHQALHDPFVRIDAGTAQPRSSSVIIAVRPLCR